MHYDPCMKTRWIACSTALIFLPVATAQVVAPASPKKFVPRAIGGGTSGGVQVLPRDSGAPKKVRYTTRIVLSPSRVWTSNDGKPVEAKLIAFEDIVVETPEGAAPPEPPPKPEHLTVVRGGKARLLVNNKPMEVPLSRLSQDDQDFIEEIRKANEPKPAESP
jgi:hypothetical protein